MRHKIFKIAFCLSQWICIPLASASGIDEQERPVQIAYKVMRGVEKVVENLAENPENSIKGIEGIEGVYAWQRYPLFKKHYPILLKTYLKQISFNNITPEELNTYLQRINVWRLLAKDPSEAEAHLGSFKQEYSGFFNDYLEQVDFRIMTPEGFKTHLQQVAQWQPFADNNSAETELYLRSLLYELNLQTTVFNPETTEEIAKLKKREPNIMIRSEKNINFSSKEKETLKKMEVLYESIKEILLSDQQNPFAKFPEVVEMFCNIFSKFHASLVVARLTDSDKSKHYREAEEAMRQKVEEISASLG
ncbi:MAG: hypothetical protein ABFQ95_03390 [Pseudomonadota bacterium]